VANEKISELPAGSPAQPSDAIPIARGGQNFSIAVSDIGGGGGGGGGINASFGGNTAGVLSLVSTGTLFLAGGNNVTLSQNGNSVTISANTAAAANISISAGTQSNAFGGITFGNSNNISFGLNNGTITATASQSNQTDGVYIFGNTTGQSTSNTHDARSLSIIASGLVSAGWSAGAILLSAPTLPPLFSGVGISTGGNSAGITGVQSQQLVLVGGSNVTLSGSGAAGSGTVTINVPSQTVQTIGVYAQSQTFGQSSSSTYDARSLSIVGQGNVVIGQSGASIFISGASNSGASGSIFAAGNTTGQSSVSGYPLNSFNVSAAGIISAGWSSNSFVISAPASTGISQSMFAVSNTTLGTSGTQTIGQLSLAGAGNISVGVSNGSYVISGAGGAGGGGVNFGVSTGGNTAGATGTVSTGNVVLVGSGPISLSQATGGAGSAATITINAPATSSISGTGQVSVGVAGSTISIGVPTVSVFLNGNTTLTSSGTMTNGQLNISGAGNVTLGYSLGTIIASATGGGGGGNFTAGVSGGNTSNTSGTVSNAFILAGGNNVTLSASTGAGGMSVTISAAAQSSASFSLFAVGNTTQLSSTVKTGFPTINAIGGISAGVSGGSIVLSAPPVSSISGTGLLSVSVNGSTISLGVAGTTESVWVPYWGSQSAVQIGNGSIQVFPANMDRNFSASRADIYASVSGSTIALSTYAGTVSAFIGIYTRNASTLSLASSGSQSFSFSNSSNNNTTAFSGLRNISVPINVNGSPQDAWLAVMTQTASANTNAWTASNMLIPGNAAPLAGLIGASANATQQQILGLGVFSVSSAAMPSSMAFSAIQGTGSAAAMIPAIVFHNVTA
jgi:hypothetical protein